MISECSRRNAGWNEGTWVVLADGQRWCFPQPTEVPGYEAEARRIAREVVDSLMPLLNIEAVKQQVASMREGDPGSLLKTIGSFFAMYQSGFQAGFLLLSHNYAVSIEEYAELMPFDYQLSELGDPNSKVNTATPRLLAIFNEVAKLAMVDIGPEMKRIQESN